MLLLRPPHLPQPMSSPWNTNWDANTSSQQLYAPQHGTNAGTLAPANGDVGASYDAQNMSGVNWDQNTWPLQSGHDAQLVEAWVCSLMNLSSQHLILRPGTALLDASEPSNGA